MAVSPSATTLFGARKGCAVNLRVVSVNGEAIGGPEKLHKLSIIVRKDDGQRAMVRGWSGHYLGTDSGDPI